VIQFLIFLSPDDSMATPCIVKTNGVYFVPPFFEVTICDLKGHSRVFEGILKPTGSIGSFFFCISWRMVSKIRRMSSSWEETARSSSSILSASSRLDSKNFLIWTKALIMAMLTSIAFLELRTEDSIETPCSVNANGMNLIF